MDEMGKLFLRWIEQMDKMEKEMQEYVDIFHEAFDWMPESPCTMLLNKSYANFKRLSTKIRTFISELINEQSDKAGGYILYSSVTLAATFQFVFEKHAYRPYPQHFRDALEELRGKNENASEVQKEIWKRQMDCIFKFMSPSVGGTSINSNANSNANSQGKGKSARDKYRNNEEVAMELVARIANFENVSLKYVFMIFFHFERKTCIHA